MFDYEPEAPDELALHRGDLIRVLRKDTEDEGWWEGEHEGRRGVFPDNFVLLLLPVKPLRPTRPSPRESLQKPEKRVPHPSKGESRLGRRPKAKEPNKMEPKPPPPPVKKPAPGPPVPAKTRPGHPVASKPSGARPATGERQRARDSDGNAGSFDAIPVTDTKLSHPTSKRPKLQGRRPPSHPAVHAPAPEPGAGQPSPPKPPSQPNRTPRSSPQSETPQACAPSPGSELEEPGLLGELRAELASLRNLLDLLQTRHERDMEEVRSEMISEREKRLALEAQVQRVKEAML
ncbi:SH3 domain-containing protein 21 [Ornithorhynchus anatinus]|uniref:SH3 domain-containing protein 21 n=1 Tax=Ornithorhynchus anatinus TaxID=9258 RepID=UPI0019D45C35|nr:SH3 domain-containing protein 21 [Ornithorhynchus anatinus]